MAAKKSSKSACKSVTFKSPRKHTVKFCSKELTDAERNRLRAVRIKNLVTKACTKANAPKAACEAARKA